MWEGKPLYDELSNDERALADSLLALSEKVGPLDKTNGIWVGMCGEMAGEPEFALLLLGFGLDEFSMSPVVIPEIKRIIRCC